MRLVRLNSWLSIRNFFPFCAPFYLLPSDGGSFSHFPLMRLCGTCFIGLSSYCFRRMLNPCNEWNFLWFLVSLSVSVRETSRLRVESFFVSQSVPFPFPRFYFACIFSFYSLISSRTDHTIVPQRIRFEIRFEKEICLLGLACSRSIPVLRNFLGSFPCCAFIIAWIFSLSIVLVKIFLLFCNFFSFAKICAENGQNCPENAPKTRGQNVLAL